MNLLLLLCTATTALAALFVKEDKVCDPLKNNVWPYTGFRLHRQYSFTLVPPFKHYVRLSHCAKGRVNYEAYALVERNAGMAWVQNMCGFTVATDVPMMSNYEKLARVARLKKNDKKPGNWERAKAAWRAMMLLKAKNTGDLDKTMEGLAQVNSFKTIAPKATGPANFCYRAVRRKKYALRDISVYTPNTFVGGLFLCPKDEACTNQNAQPVMPLHSDDVSLQWFEFEPITDSNPLRYQEIKKADAGGNMGVLSKFFEFLSRKRHVIQRVPYFFTKHKYGRVDQAYSPPGGEWPEWALELDVNEAYNYTRKEVNLVSQAVSQTANVLSKYFSISANALPWEGNVLDQLELDGEVYRKNPKTNIEELESERSTETDSREVDMGNLAAYVQRDVIQAARMAKLAQTQVQQLVVELQEPFHNLQLKHETRRQDPYKK